MKVYKCIEDYRGSKDSFITIGTFDGLHIGHRAIINNLVNDARSKNADAVVLTFFPHPRSVVNGNKKFSLIDSMDEKENLLKALGVNILIIHPFTNEFSNLSPLEFTKDILVNQLNIKKLVIGYDHRFGKDRKASVSDIISYSKIYGFKVDVIPAQDIKKVLVSSTKIREALSNGEIKIVNEYLDREYMIEGTVFQDQGLGSEIGFPTANIQVTSSYKALPKKGVYWVSSIWKNKKYFGMLNFGNRPSVKNNTQTIEVHFFNFNENIYNQTIKINFHSKIRDEKKFDSIESLKAQLEIDKEFCHELEKNE